MAEINTTVTSSGRPRRSLRAVLFEFLGSMHLAISLLVAVAIASVIGTVLVQNRPYNEYYDRFGQFWFDVFHTLGLYDVYGTAWFLGILGFLVISTSVCIYRNTPIMLRDMRSFRLNVRLKSLQAFHHRQEWRVDAPLSEVRSRASAYLKSQNYRVRSEEHGDHVILAAVRGRFNRVGYIFAHAAVVVICLGGLIDGHVGLRLREDFGGLKVLHQDMPMSQVPASSRLAAGSTISFRGDRTVPEGGTMNSVTLSLQDGYVVQELPFSIHVAAFRIQYYPTGQPKSFQSDLVIHDPRLAKPLKRTVEVNHPLVYRGYSIFQASFGDGGSRITLEGWPLTGPKRQPIRIKTAVFDHTKLMTPDGPKTLELTNFRFYNIMPVAGAAPDQAPRNYGPSVIYKLRNPAGDAYEYVTYMVPVEHEGRMYYLTGVRKSEAQGFQYLRIPLDRVDSIKTFMRLRAMLNDPALLRPIVEQNAAQTFKVLKKNDPALQKKLVTALMAMIHQFAVGGMDAILEHIQKTLPREQMRQGGQTYINALRSIVLAVYMKVLQQEGVNVSDGVTNPNDQQFFLDAFQALSVLPNYGSAYFFHPVDFKQIQATGLQITREPGTKFVFLGAGLLILGIFVMFYIAHRRAWVWLSEADGRTTVLFAGTSNRNAMDFSREFERMRAQLGPFLSGG